MEWKYKVVHMAIKDGHQLVHDIASTKVFKNKLNEYVFVSYIIVSIFTAHKAVTTHFEIRIEF